MKIEENDIRLVYQETTVREWQWLLLYEFEVCNHALFELDDQNLLNIIIGTRILDRGLNHPEFGHQQVEVGVDGIWRPYNFEKLKANHFKFLPDEACFNLDIEILKRSELGSDFEKITFDQVTKEQEIVKKRTTFPHGVWYINRDWFEDDNEILDDLQWVFLYFQTYVEIDREKKLIRTLDFGWD